MFAMPAAANGYASLSFWQHTPFAPAAIWRFAISLDLCAFACGLSVTPAAAANSAICRTLDSNASRSMTSDGVPIASSGSPGRAGAGGTSFKRYLLVQAGLRSKRERQHARDVKRLGLRAVVNLM